MVLRSDAMECFFSYDYNEKKTKFLHSAAKDIVPNAVLATTFKKNFYEALHKRRRNEKSSPLFYFSLRSLIERRK